MNLGADGINPQALRLNFVPNTKESASPREITKEVLKMAGELITAIQQAANSSLKEAGTLPGAAQAIAGKVFAQKIDLPQLLKVLDIFLRIEVMEEHANLITRDLSREDAALLQFAAGVLGSKKRFRQEVAKGIKLLREEGRDPLASLNAKLENGAQGVSEFLEEIGILGLEEFDTSIDLRDPKATKKIKNAIEKAYRQD